ncbi:hypothetical protein [Stenotrophomonas maltophilia]|nr:hypothetical protein [Stenotrophomonas maltophilia]
MKNKTPPQGGVFVCSLIVMHARVALMCLDDGMKKPACAGLIIC